MRHSQNFHPIVCFLRYIGYVIVIRTRGSLTRSTRNFFFVCLTFRSCVWFLNRSPDHFSRSASTSSRTRRPMWPATAPAASSPSAFHVSSTSCCIPSGSRRAARRKKPAVVAFIMHSLISAVRQRLYLWLSVLNLRRCAESTSPFLL